MSDAVATNLEKHLHIRSVSTRWNRLSGAVTQANGAFSVGQPVRILAQTRGDATAIAIAIAIGDLAFAGAGLVVIAIIAGCVQR